MMKLYKYEKHFVGTVTVTMQNENYEVDVRATGTYCYEPQVLYFSDGTGQEEHESLTVNEVIVEKVQKENPSLFNVWDDMTDLYEKNIVFKSDIDEEVWNKLEDNWYDYDWVSDEFDYEQDKDY